MVEDSGMSEDRDAEIQDIIERKVNERIEAQKKEIKEEAKKELKEEIFGKKNRKKEGTNVSEGISRRSFLKKLGLGAAGLGALSLSPVSGLDVRSGSGLEVFQDGNEYLDVGSAGVDVLGTDLDLNNNNITNVNTINGQDADSLGGVTSHTGLTDVNSDNHHSYPVPSSGIASDAVTNTELARNSVTGTELVDGEVSTSHLGFDTATQSELDGHAGNTTNPHNVTDDQTGAADALSNHEGDSAAHHASPSLDSAHYTPSSDGTEHSYNLSFTGNGFVTYLYCEYDNSDATSSTQFIEFVLNYKDGTSDTYYFEFPYESQGTKAWTVKGHTSFVDNIDIRYEAYESSYTDGIIDIAALDV